MQYLYGGNDKEGRIITMMRIKTRVGLIPLAAKPEVQKATNQPLLI